MPETGSLPTIANVLITRSEPGASRLAQKLKAENYLPILAPMSAIVPDAAGLARLSSTLTQEPPPFFVVTSGHGARILADAVAADHAQYRGRVFAVARRTAQILHDAGFRDVVAGSGGAEELSRLILAHLGRALRAESKTDKNASATQIWHLAGRQAGHGLRDALRAGGLGAETLFVYSAIPAPDFAPILQTRLGMHHGIVLFHAAQAAAIFAQWIRRENREPDLAAWRAIAISARVLAPISDLPWADHAIAGAKNETAMLEALRELTARKTALE